VEFGLSRRPAAGPVAPGLTWQPGISDADAAITACEQTGLQYEVTTERPRADWTYRIVKVQSPNGMEVLLEEQPPQD
jgi:hypothetical protein